MPATNQFFVEPFLATEVVGDELGVHPGAVGDLSDPRPGIALVRELAESGVQDALPGPIGVPLAIGRVRGPTGRIRFGLTLDTGLGLALTLTTLPPSTGCIHHPGDVIIQSLDVNHSDD
jgi:hypothetical protein